MSMPYYVSPEQLIKDKADFARKGISRGRSVVVLSCTDGIVMVAENPSGTLHKLSEIYDRIGFAAVGKYNEFESLRVGGIRFADQRGYTYDRSDVSARSLANVYAQTLGTVFTEAMKPYEVEIVVAEVGRVCEEDQIYRIIFDGSVRDEIGYTCMGGDSDELSNRFGARWQPGLSRDDAIRLCRDVLQGNRTLGAPSLEVAWLRRESPRRTFVRVAASELTDILDG